LNHPDDKENPQQKKQLKGSSTHHLYAKFSKINERNRQKVIDQIEKEERALKAEQLKKGGSKELQNQDNFLKQESEIEF
jgi:hypothetical protein